MKLTDVGESRVRGYLFVLERSLRSFLPRDVVLDAVREVESHIRERLDQSSLASDERAAVERVLGELGPPLRVAQAYSLEMTVDEAVATGRVTSMTRALWHLATTTAGGFLAAVMVLWGYVAGFVMIATALIEPFLPRHVIFGTRLGVVPVFEFSYPTPPAGPDPFGILVVPFALLCGAGVLVGTQRGARKWLAWWIDRRRQMHLRLVNIAPAEE